MVFLLTVAFEAVFTIFVNLQLFFEAIHVLFNGTNVAPLLSMSAECFAAWIIVGVVKILMCAFHKWRKVGSYHQSRNSILLGLFLIAFFSILGKIFIEKIRDCHTTTAFIFFIVTCFFASYSLFIHPSSGNCYWSTKPGRRGTYEVLLMILLFIHAGWFIKTIMDGTGSKHHQAYLIGQFCYSCICASSTCELLAILMGRLEEKSEKLQQSDSDDELEEDIEVNSKERRIFTCNLSVYRKISG